jgi:hypothetical protein
MMVGNGSLDDPVLPQRKKRVVLPSRRRLNALIVKAAISKSGNFAFDCELEIRR